MIFWQPTVGSTVVVGGSESNLLYVTGGVLSQTTALPDGTTCTTQTALDGSTKVASNAYADNAAKSESLLHSFLLMGA